MNSNEIESHVREAFSSAKPDILDSILSDSKPHKGEIVDIGAAPRKKRSCTRLLRAAAILLICFVCIGGFSRYNRANAVWATVTLDTDTSAELKLNRDENVISASFTGGDSTLDPESLKGLSAGEAIERIAAAEFESNILNDNENSILITVGGADPETAEDIEGRLSAGLSTSLEEKGLNASVMAQTAVSSEEADSALAALDLSPGRLSLISRIQSAGTELGAEALAEMSINELNLLISCSDMSPEGLDIQGRAGMGLYVDEDTVRLTAGSDLGLGDDSISSLDVRFGFRDGVPVYYVNYDTSIYSYSCILDAVSGSIEESREDFTEEFSNWYNEQDEDVRSWVDENSGSLHDIADAIAGDCRAAVDSCISEIGNLTEGIAETVAGLVDLFLP